MFLIPEGITQVHSSEQQNILVDLILRLPVTNIAISAAVSEDQDLGRYDRAQRWQAARIGGLLCLSLYVVQVAAFC
jgi:hypothetical protein